MQYQNKTSTLSSTKDGGEIFWQKWIPGGATNRVIVFQHGVGEHSNRFGNLVQSFENESTALYALDARGHGQTAGKRGHVKSFQLFADDLGDLIQIAKNENPGIPLYLLGHSLGALMSLQYVIEPGNQKQLDGLLLSTPPIKIVMDAAKKVKKAVGSLLAYVIPSVTVDTELNLQSLSHDQEVIEAYKADPLVHGKISMAAASQSFAVAETVMANAKNITLPIYIWHGMEDEICHAESSRLLYDAVGSENKTLKFYDRLFHETMNEAGDDKWTVLNDVKAWLNKQKTPAAV